MGTFTTFLITWLIAGFIINSLCRLLMRTKLEGQMPTSTVISGEDYIRGFGTGVTNLKMYYYSTGKIPTLEWLDANMSTILNTREKLEATLNEEDKSLVYSDTQKQ